MVEDGRYCYGAQVSKIHINKNCARLSAHADLQLKKPVHLEVNELIPYKIVNKTLTISDKHHAGIKMIVDEEQLIISGTLNESAGEIAIGGVISNSVDHLKSMIREILSNLTTYSLILCSTPW